MTLKVLTAAALAVSLAGTAHALKDGLTRDQAGAASARKFKQMDSDGKGGVTPAELSAFMEKQSAKRGEPVDPVKVDKRWKRLDTDASGSVTPAELQVEELASFDRKDLNKNGKIDANEAE
ncbi:MAG: EF-hand domain-containing protein [Pseudomonadota bacterium]